jgi:RND family efflux transporter MFP subunit
MSPETPDTAPPATPAPKTPPARPRRSPVRLIVLLLVIGGIGYAIWSYKHRNEGYTSGNVTTTGTVEAVQVSLGFKVPGKLAEVPVTEGDRVHAGQVVAKLEAQDLAVQVESARAKLESARASLLQARANRDKAARELSRARELQKGGYASAQQLDAAHSEAEVTQAQVAAAEGEIHQAQSALAQAQLQLSYATLVAPRSAQVTEVIHRPGEMVTVGTSVVTLTDLDTLKVHAAVDETRVGAVRPGDPVSIKVYTFDKRTFSGVVTDVAPSGDFATRKDWGAQRRDIRTFDVTARVPNPEGLLKDGMTAEVTILIEPEAKPVAERGP